jgi:hypothetical protein
MTETAVISAEQIIRREARRPSELNRFHGGLFGHIYTRGDPINTQISIGGLSGEDRQILIGRYRGRNYKDLNSRTTVNDIRWALRYEEPRRLRSIFEILPLLEGSNKIGYVLEALADELGKPRAKFHDYYMKHRRSRWDWSEFRHWCKLHPKLGED